MATVSHSDVRIYSLDGRHPGRGHVLLILADGPTDLAAAAVAAARARDAGVLLYTAAAVAGTGFSINALLHRARAHRQDADAAGITARVAPALRAAGVGHFMNSAALRLPHGVRHRGALPGAAISRLARNLDAALVITTLPIREPLHGLAPATSGEAAPDAGGVAPST